MIELQKLQMCLAAVQAALGRREELRQGTAPANLVTKIHLLTKCPACVSRRGKKKKGKAKRLTADSSQQLILCIKRLSVAASALSLQTVSSANILLSQQTSLHGESGDKARQIETVVPR